MSLATIRAQVVEENGRYDLVNSDGSDNGMDTYINRGIRMLLDSLVETDASRRVYAIKTTIGDPRIIIPDLKAVKSEAGKPSVERVDGKKRIPLDYREYQNDFYTMFPEATSDYGTPSEWMYGEGTLAPAQQDIDSVTLNLVDETGLRFEADESSKMLYVYPTPDAVYQINVHGLFLSKVLSLDADENWWTYNYEDLCVIATHWALEVSLSNTEGVKDWLFALQEPIKKILEFYITEDYGFINQMRG